MKKAADHIIMALLVCVWALVAHGISSPAAEEHLPSWTPAGRGSQAAPFPLPDLEQFEPVVKAQILRQQEAVRTKLSSGEATPEGRGEALWELGLVYHAYDLTNEAEECYRRAIELYAARFEWKYCLAYLLQTAGKYSEAIVLYQQAQSLRPDYFLMALRVGECYRALNRLDEARQAFESALRLNPSEPAAMARLGELAAEEGRYEEAIDRLQAALQRLPGANKLHYALATAYRGLGKMEEARKHLALRGNVGIQPADPLTERLKHLAQGSRVLTLRGKTAYAAGRYEEASEAFRAALVAAPDDAGGRINYGSSLVKEGRLDEALVQYREAVRLAPGNLTARYNLGTLLSFRGKYEEAAVHLAAVTAAEPDDAAARQAYAEALRMQGRAAEAFSQYQAAVRLDPSLAAAWLMMADMLVHTGQFRESLVVLEEASRKLPLDRRILLTLTRQLAASPDSRLRDGRRSLGLAMKLFEEKAGFEEAAAVALAEAELGDCGQAVHWQDRALQLAKDAGAAPQEIDRMTSKLAHFRENRPCRAPVIAEQPGGVD